MSAVQFTGCRGYRSCSIAKGDTAVVHHSSVTLGLNLSPDFVGPPIRNVGTDPMSRYRRYLNKTADDISLPTQTRSFVELAPRQSLRLHQGDSVNVRSK